MDDENEIRDKMLAIIRGKAKEIYSEKIVEYGTNPGNYGRIDLPDGYAKNTDACGESIEVFLKVANGKIADSRFMSNGCIFTVAACNAAAEMAKGKTVHDCITINRSSIMSHLGGVPEDHEHCALSAALVFQRALRNYITGCRLK